MSDDEILQEKIKKSINLICQLYKRNIIENAYIVGSVAKGTAKKESDIDIYLMNPLFQEEAEVEPLSIQQFILSQHLEKTEKEKLLYKWKANIGLVDILKNIGAEFKQINRKDQIFWYQLYRGELFHIMTRSRMNPFIEDMVKIELTRDLCSDQSFML